MLTLLLPHPVALIKTGKTKTMVIADPHLGWEIALRDKGICVPSQTPKLLQKLTPLLSKHKPDTLLILGDVKYTVIAIKPGEWHDIPDFFTQLKNYVSNIVIMRGNHDANLEHLLPEKIKLLPASGTIVGDVGLFHGHKWPSPTLLKSKTLIMAHLHPVVVFRDPAGFKITRQVWVKAKCNTTQLSKTLLQKQRIKIEGTPEETVKKHYNFKPRTVQFFIMPSFNEFLGGRPINETAPRKEGQISTMIGPVLRSEAVDLNNSEIYLLDGTFLGTLNQFRRL
ncbi:MAG: metallophosphoesterase [Candidatus Bathyarchaeota archaeon]|nr:MAG: metallophosphoesterase [Candidatus Bathyarchaeota archaeon]